MILNMQLTGIIGHPAIGQPVDPETGGEETMPAFAMLLQYMQESEPMQQLPGGNVTEMPQEQENEPAMYAAASIHAPVPARSVAEHSQQNFQAEFTKRVEGIGVSLKQPMAKDQPVISTAALRSPVDVPKSTVETKIETPIPNASAIISDRTHAALSRFPAEPHPIKDEIPFQRLTAERPAIVQITEQQIAMRPTLHTSAVPDAMQYTGKLFAASGQMPLHKESVRQNHVRSVENSSGNIPSVMRMDVAESAAAEKELGTNIGNETTGRGVNIAEVTVLNVNNNQQGEKTFSAHLFQQTQNITPVKITPVSVPEIVLENANAKTSGMIELPRTAMNDMVRALSMRHNQDTSEIRFKLKPEHLGELVIKVRLDGGKMVAQAEVAQTSVKAALEQQLPQLREMLASRGIDLQRFDVYSEKQSANDDKNSRWTRNPDDRKRHKSQIETIDLYQTSRSLGYNTIEMIF